MRGKTRKIVMLGMLCAIAYVVMMVGRIPVVLFLKYDPKDVIITMGGFMFGPMAAFMISTVVSLVEMLTVSDTGPIGMIMNLLASCSFACTAAVIYKKKHSQTGALVGLLCGIIVSTGLMLLWNYLITPFYLGVEREDVVALLIPAILPFNLLKGGINTAIVLLIYKPVVKALRKARLLDGSQSQALGAQTSEMQGKPKVGIIIVGVVLLVSCILFFLVLRGII